MFKTVSVFDRRKTKRMLRKRGVSRASSSGSEGLELGERDSSDPGSGWMRDSSASGDNTSDEDKKRKRKRKRRLGRAVCALVKEWRLQIGLIGLAKTEEQKKQLTAPLKIKWERLLLELRHRLTELNEACTTGFTPGQQEIHNAGVVCDELRRALEPISDEFKEHSEGESFDGGSVRGIMQDIAAQDKLEVVVAALRGVSELSSNPMHQGKSSA